MIYLASDHAGFELKQKIATFLRSQNLAFEDLGPQAYDPNDDYPDFVTPAMQKMQTDSSLKAIVICKNGVGVCMLANKFKNIRCALSWNPHHVKSAREDDDTNVLALPAGYIDEPLANEIVKTWLETPFSQQDRHKRRLQKVAKVEKAY